MQVGAGRTGQARPSCGSRGLGSWVGRMPSSSQQQRSSSVWWPGGRGSGQAAGAHQFSSCESACSAPAPGTAQRGGPCVSSQGGTRMCRRHAGGRTPCGGWHSRRRSHTPAPPGCPTLAGCLQPLPEGCPQPSPRAAPTRGLAVPISPTSHLLGREAGLEQPGHWLHLRFHLRPAAAGGRLCRMSAISATTSAAAQPAAQLLCVREPPPEGRQLLVAACRCQFPSAGQ